MAIAYRRLGMAYDSDGEHDRALVAFRRAIEMDPEHYRNYQALGNFLIVAPPTSKRSILFEKLSTWPLWRRPFCAGQSLHGAGEIPRKPRRRCGSRSRLAKRPRL